MSSPDDAEGGSDRYIPEMTQKTAAAINKLFVVLQTAENALPEMRAQIHEAYASLNALTEALAPKWKNLNGWKAREKLRRLT